mgnify:CR=1 FL=1
MTEGPIAKKICFFSIPLILGNFLQLLYNTVDSIIVGNFLGSHALAAVGSTTSLIFLLVAFSQGASVGAGVVMAQYLGAGNLKNVRATTHTALAIALLLGLILTIGGIFLSRPLLIWMNTPSDVFADSLSYFQLYCGGLLFSVIYNMAAGIMNAAGNSKRPLYYLGCASIINMILDIVLVNGIGIGINGAAIATDISQFIACLFAIKHLIDTSADYKIQLSKIAIHRRIAKQIIHIGLPTGIQNMVISFSNVLVQSGVNSFGAAAMAGFAAFLRIDGFNILPILSISMAMTTFTGQNYGAGNIERIKKGIKVVLIMGFSYTIFIGSLVLAFSDPIMRLFSHDASVIAYGRLAMHYFCPFYFLLGILQGLAGTVRGTGKSIPPMVVLLISLCLFRIIWLQFILPLFHSIDGLYALYPVSWALGMLMMILYAWKGHWLQNTKRVS